MGEQMKRGWRWGIRHNGFIFGPLLSLTLLVGGIEWHEWRYWPPLLVALSWATVAEFHGASGGADRGYGGRGD